MSVSAGIQHVTAMTADEYINPINVGPFSVLTMRDGAGSDIRAFLEPGEAQHFADLFAQLRAPKAEDAA